MLWWNEPPGPNGVFLWGAPRGAFSDGGIKGAARARGYFVQEIKGRPGPLLREIGPAGPRSCNAAEPPFQLKSTLPRLAAAGHCDHHARGDGAQGIGGRLGYWLNGQISWDIGSGAP